MRNMNDFKNDFNGMINDISDSINNINKNNNHTNLSDYSERKLPDYNRGNITTQILDKINDTDWEQESKYYNYYRRNGKTNMGNTIKCKNTDYLKRLNNDR